MLAERAVAGNVAHSGSGGAEKRLNDAGNVGPHGDISVNVNTG